jgi:hypothetical protein
VRYRAQRFGDVREVEEACRRVIDRCNGKFPESGAWLQSMYRRFGEEAFWRASAAFDAGDLEYYRESLAFAKEYYPDLCHSGTWWRFRAKRLLGRAVWARVRPVFNRLRGVRSEQPYARWRPPQVGHQFGWWPDAVSEAMTQSTADHGAAIASGSMGRRR